VKFSENLEIADKEYASQGNAILGIRDSGKSYTATYIAERLLDARIPFIAFDPIGIWRYLKVGKNGPGYPVVVAGGESGDVILRSID
jgi:DNA helicase HerA-like ATPase